MRATILFLILLFVAMSMKAKANQNEPRSRAERTDYKETTRYAEVMEYIGGLQRLDSGLRVETFGTSHEGRALPLVILSRPGVHSPAEAAASGKLIVFIMANIHAGEVEGKEAMLHFMRDLVTGRERGLLERMILLIAPIYNADGNEKIDIKNRTAQNGPYGGVGTRENAQRLDLNRDFMKLKSPEARGLVTGVFNRWDPHVIIDLHTTNGSFHGYALTYSPSLNPNTDERIIAFARQQLFPSITRTMRTRFGYRTYYYGNFMSEDEKGELRFDNSAKPNAWVTFDHRPRFGNSYVGLRNRIAILSEAYSYLDFRKRVDVTDKFVRTVLRYLALHGPQIVKLVSDADRDAARTRLTMGNKEGYGVAFKLKKNPKPVTILVGGVNRVDDPRTGRPRFKATDEARPVRMSEYGEFEPTKRVQPPAAYILKPEQRAIVDVLLMHGIIVETTTQDEQFSVERYEVQEATRAPREFQGQREMRLKVKAESGREKFPAGSFIVSMDQPKAALIFYLLEPESDDGLANWNYFDDAIEAAQKAGGKTIFPVFRLTEPPRMPRLVLR